MTTAIIRSFEPDKGLVCVVVTGALAEVPLRPEIDLLCALLIVERQLVVTVPVRRRARPLAHDPRRRRDLARVRAGHGHVARAAAHGVARG